MEQTRVTRDQFERYWVETFIVKFEEMFDGINPDHEEFDEEDDNGERLCSNREGQWNVINDKDVTESEMIHDAELFFRLAKKIKDGTQKKIPGSTLVHLTLQTADELSKQGLFSTIGMDNMEVIAAGENDQEGMKHLKSKLAEMEDDEQSFHRIISNKITNPFSELDKQLRVLLNDEEESWENFVFPWEKSQSEKPLPVITRQQFDLIFETLVEPAFKKYAPSSPMIPNLAKDALFSAFEAVEASAILVSHPMGGMLSTIRTAHIIIGDELSGAAFAKYFLVTLLEGIKSILSKAKSDYKRNHKED